MSKKTDREMQFKENGFSKIKQNQNGEKTETKSVITVEMILKMI